MRFLAVLASILFLAQAAVAMPLRDGEYHAVINGVRHWYRIAGARHRTIPLVIVHGGPGGSSYNFEHGIGPLIERFATVVYYDQRGCGRSDAPVDESAYDIPTLISDLDQLRAHLGLSRITPLGYSFGGEFAIEYALRYPQHLDRLIVQSAVNGDHVRIARFQAYGFALGASGERRARLEALATEPATNAFARFDAVWGRAGRAEVDQFLFQSPAAAALNNRLSAESGHRNTGRMARIVVGGPPRNPPLTHELHRIAVPTLVMVGLYDRNVGVDSNREIAQLIPNSQLIIFERSAHFPDLEEPRRYAVAIRRFLAARFAGR